MPLTKNLSDLQLSFFRALTDSDSVPAELRGRIEIYRHAYFERVRASIEEDFPQLFEFLETLITFPGGLNAERVTRDLLERNHPSSWTLAEASLPVMASVVALLEENGLASELAEARKLAEWDEAEGLAGWLAEWPEPKGERATWIGEFAAGRLRLVRTKTWCRAGDLVFWRSEKGAEETAISDFSRFSTLLSFVTQPTDFRTFGEAVAECAPADVTAFLERGIAGGWLRLTE